MNPPPEETMQKFRALSYGDKWRIARLIAMGEAPQDPEMAAAAVELAESYQRRQRRAPMVFRWLAIFIALVAYGLGVLAAVQGDVLLVITMTLLLITNLAHLALNPAARPEHVARALEAARQVSAAGS